MTHKFTIYRSHGQFRWRIVARNGRKVANSGEAYRNRADLISSARRMFAASAAILAQIEASK